MMEAVRALWAAYQSHGRRRITPVVFSRNSLVRPRVVHLLHILLVLQLPSSVNAFSEWLNLLHAMDNLGKIVLLAHTHQIHKARGFYTKTECTTPIHVFALTEAYGRLNIGYPSFLSSSILDGLRQQETISPKQLPYLRRSVIHVLHHVNSEYGLRWLVAEIQAVKAQESEKLFSSMGKWNRESKDPSPRTMVFAFREVVFALRLLKYAKLNREHGSWMSSNVLARMKLRSMVRGESLLLNGLALEWHPFPFLVADTLHSIIQAHDKTRPSELDQEGERPVCMNSDRVEFDPRITRALPYLFEVCSRRGVKHKGFLEALLQAYVLDVDHLPVDYVVRIFYALARLGYFPSLWISPLTVLFSTALSTTRGLPIQQLVSLRKCVTRALKLFTSNPELFLKTAESQSTVLPISSSYSITAAKQTTGRVPPSCHKKLSTRFDRRGATMNISKSHRSALLKPRSLAMAHCLPDCEWKRFVYLALAYFA